MISGILENAFIEKLAKGFRRSPLQLNRLQESDAELMRLPGSAVILALTTDSIVEEIRSGLYDDPYLAGWMAVLVNVSDLAAVGAQGMGILISETLRVDTDEQFLMKLQQGLAECAAAAGLPLLGGDTNFDTHMSLTACAVGQIEGGNLLTRKGCCAGDHVFLSGPVGRGSAYAWSKLMNAGPSVTYRPKPRIREGQLLRKHASACIDTSDGLIAALDQLARVNGGGFEIESAVSDYLDAASRQLCRGLGLPDWLMLAGPHGEFELLFTVSEEQTRGFLEEAAGMDWYPLEIGRVCAENRVCLQIEGEKRTLNTTAVRNLFTEVGGDVEKYVAGLLQIHEQIIKESEDHASDPKEWQHQAG